jgi:hypothetical protein
LQHSVLELIDNVGHCPHVGIAAVRLSLQPSSDFDPLLS